MTTASDSTVGCAAALLAATDAYLTTLGRGPCVDPRAARQAYVAALEGVRAVHGADAIEAGWALLERFARWGFVEGRRWLGGGA